jgi:hypothetical protein
MSTGVAQVLLDVATVSNVEDPEVRLKQASTTLDAPVHPVRMESGSTCSLKVYTAWSPLLGTPFAVPGALAMEVPVGCSTLKTVLVVADPEAATPVAL